MVPFLHVRAATRADAEAIAAVHVAGWQWGYRGQLPDDFLAELSVERYRVSWSNMLDQDALDQWTWVAEQAETIVGFCGTGPSRDADADPGTGEVYAIYLDQSVAGQGIGRALCAHAVAQLRQHGFWAATLWVLETNARARRFYEAAGWCSDGTIKTETRAEIELREVRYRINLAIGA